MATVPQEIPVTLDVPYYTERITLDGREYVFQFDYSEREAPGRWYLAIYDISGTLLAAGIKLVANWPLLRQKADPRLPAGHLTALDSAQDGEPPTFQDLGRRVVLTYFPPG